MPIPVLRICSISLKKTVGNQKSGEKTIMTISIGGLASGLDTNGIIDQMLAIQQRPIERLQSKGSEYQIQLSTYGTLKGLVSSLQSAVSAIDTEGELSSYTATSGDKDLFTVTSGDDAAVGSYDVTVQQLAKVHKLTSTAFAADETIGEGTIHLKVGDAEAIDIAVSATDTYDEVASAINDADAGVKAAVVFDGTDYFLTLSAEETGADNVINLTVTETGDPGLARLIYDQGGTENMSNTQSAADAIITVDGVSDIHRSGNEIDDVIQGVTLTLVSAPAAPDNATTLTVSRNTGAARSKIDAFVKAYNQVAIFITEAQKYSEDTEVAGILMGDATTNGIRSQLKTMVTGLVSGAGTYNRLSDIGITLGSDNQLNVDTDTLDDALDNHFEDVAQFFTQSTSDAPGFAVKMGETLDAMLDSTTGTFASREDGIKNSIDSINDQIERHQLRTALWEERTRAQFNAMEALLAQYQSTGDYLGQFVTGMQNLNSFISNK
jgi:flagellar hook-associated protein 2